MARLALVTVIASGLASKGLKPDRNARRCGIEGGYNDAVRRGEASQQNVAGAIAAAIAKELGQT